MTKASRHILSIFSQSASRSTHLAKHIGSPFFVSPGLMANLYSKFGRYHSYTVELWRKHATPRMKWLVKKCRRRKLEDVEKGRTPMRPAAISRAKSSMNTPRRMEAQVGYGLASAAMIPAIM